MPNYRLIAALENKYVHLKSRKKYYAPTEASTVILLLLIFIIPGIIYVAMKSRQKRNIEAHNRAIQQQMDAVLAEVKPLL